MARTIQLTPGVRYWAGADLPWFVPQSMVSAGARDLGFADPQWHERSEQPPVDPSSDPQYQDDWTSWATAIYQGAAKPYTLPSALKWFVAEQSKPPKQVTPSSPATSDENVAYAEELLSLVNDALRSGKPELMRQAAAYFRSHNMPELATTLDDAATRTEREKAKTIAWVVGAVVAVGVITATALVALRGKK